MNKVNEQIKSSIVHVVGIDDKGIKEMKLVDAIELAESTDEDVIQISVSKEGIPIVRIEEYSKFIYREKKKQKESAKKQRANNISFKEVRMDYTIVDHDLKIKAKTIDRLLDEGSKVKVSIIYKGRAVRQVSSGIAKMNELEQMLTSRHKVDGQIKIEGNRVIMSVITLK